MAPSDRTADAGRIAVGPAPRLVARDAAVRLGLVALSTDLTMEGDLWRLLPDRARLHVTRVAFANPTTPRNLAAMAPRLGDAAALIAPGVPLAALCFGCTSASAVIGDEAVARALSAGRPGVPVVTPTSALVAAAAHLGVARIAVVTPYLPEATQPLVAHLEAAGLGVVSVRCLGLADDRDMARIPGKDIVDAALATDHPAADALFLSCTALPALPVVEAVEARLSKPVLTSNQVCAWAMLRAGGLAPPRPVGRLLGAPAVA